MTKKKIPVNGFTTINNKIIKDSSLTNNEYRVLMILLAYYNKEKGHSYPSLERIAKEANMSKRWCNQIIKSLIKKHYIKRELRPGKTSLFTFSCKPFPKNKKKTKEKTKKKPFFAGNPMRKKNGKWFVVIDKGQWNEFTGNEKDIKWK